MGFDQVNEGIKHITDPNVNNYPTAIRIARAIYHDGEAGGRLEIERELGNRKVLDWKTEKIKDFDIPAGELVSNLTALVQKLKTSSQLDHGTLYRGFYSKNIDFSKGEISIPLSSFSSDFFTAVIHGDIILETEGPIRAIDTRGVSQVPAELEFFSDGRFKIQNVRKENGRTIVTVKQIQ